MKFHKKPINLVSDILTYSVMSAPIRSLIAYDKFGDRFETRAQLNIILVSSFGSGKGSLFREIEQRGLGVRLTDYSSAGIIGTLRPSGKLTLPFTIYCAGKTLCIDEFQKFGKSQRDALLSLMEDQYYRKPLGFEVKEELNIEDKYYKIQARGNYFAIWVKCSYICGCMHFKRKTIDDLALLSRGIPIVLTMEEDEGIELFLGKSRLILNDSILRHYNKMDAEKVEISYSVRKTLTDLFKEQLKGYKIESGFITRALWDLTRIAGVRALMDSRTEILEDDIYEAIKFAPIQILGYARGSLTFKQMEIYSAICMHEEGINPSKLKEITGYSESTIMEALKELVRVGLVDMIQVGKNTIYMPKLKLI